ncbi:hypothetical protein BC828DRAFT_383909 [Blastocladiella britannica]|nr:hypothetical protein BC828DRAFT_383909 [Blastocladiella britannica]
MPSNWPKKQYLVLRINYGNALSRLPPELLASVLECTRPASQLPASNSLFATHCRQVPSIQVSWATARISQTVPALPTMYFNLLRPPHSLGIPAPARRHVVGMVTTSNIKNERHVAGLRQAHVFWLPAVLDHLLSPQRWAHLASTSPTDLLAQWTEYTRCCAPAPWSLPVPWQRSSIHGRDDPTPSPDAAKASRDRSR